MIITKTDPYMIEEIENIINGISDYVVDYSNPEDIISWFDANILKILYD